ncbi:NAD(P)H-hydrate dehydratase [SAR202 cluster bacterium AC-647-N09_OGT_505m]|nr:NAD(P)H-hydrate dehydratase [SAR202 cluster bacterium AC-647-N09_OGT_505m]
MKIVTTEEMRLLEERCGLEGISQDTLMEKAGLAVAQKAREFLGDVRGVPILTLVGPGNNGGDGLVATHHLSNWGADATVYVALPRKNADPNGQLLLDPGAAVCRAEDDIGFSWLTGQLAKVSLVIDAVLGTGRARPIEGTLAEILSMLVNARASRPKLSLMALDLPTGLNADTGESDPLCPAADVTVALGFPKVGLFGFPGASQVGRLDVVDIGIPVSLAEDVPQELITSDWVKNTLPRRPLDSHKGTFGRVLVVAGSMNYIGAAYLACEGAARVGAGLVTLAIPRSLQPLLATKLTEVTYLLLPEEEDALSPEASDVILSELPGYQALLAGCGLGQGSDVAQLLQQTLNTARYPGVPMVLDADALNIMSRQPEWWLGLKGEAVVTPHPGEMSRLTGRTTKDINSARLNTTRERAIQWSKSVVLKGAYTVVSSPQGQVRMSPFANPGLASAGTGDVLAGAIAGLLAQGMSTFDAASCGVYLHGAAGEQAKYEMGDTGIVASDILPRLPLAIKQVKEGKTHTN